MKTVNNKFFKTTPKSFKFFDRVLSTAYPVAEPKTNGIINICDDFNWKNPGIVEEVPKIRVVERELIYGSYTTSILTFIDQLGKLSKGVLGDPKGGSDIYPQLYATKATGFQYIFPHLLTTGSNLHSIANSWQSINSGPQTLLNSFTDGKSNKGSGIGEKALEMGVSFAIGMGTPGFGFDDMYSYQNTQPRTITITFPLYNTISLESAYDNYSFINLFMFQNLKTRTSLATYIPPKLYVVDQADTEGGFYSPVCIVSNYSVECIGTTRRMNEFRSYNIQDILMPEAYKVTIQFMELIQNSSNIFSGAIGGDKIQVTNADPNRDLNGLLKNRTKAPITPPSTPSDGSTLPLANPNTSSPIVLNQGAVTVNSGDLASVRASTESIVPANEFARVPDNNDLRIGQGLTVEAATPTITIRGTRDRLQSPNLTFNPNIRTP
jgi:hypothetical protein